MATTSFVGKAFNQHLWSLKGLTTVKGNGIISRTIMWNNGDVMATELDDQRANPEAIALICACYATALNMPPDEL